MKTDRYHELFERSTDAILIIVEDKFVDCNAATLKMLGYQNKQELLNTHPSELSPERQPDGRLSYEKANEMIAIAFEKGSHRFEWDHRRANGEVFPVEVLLTAVSEEGKDTLHVVWREITDRKKTEKALLRLTSIIESTSDLVCSATPDGRIQYMNNAGLEMFGWSEAELHGRKIIDAYPEWVMDMVNKGIAIATREGTWTGETAILGRDHREIPVSQVIMSHKTAEGELEYLSTIIRDISERKGAEKKLRNNLYLLHSIIDNQPTCVKLVRRDGTLLDMNPAGLQMVAASTKEEVVGKNIYDIIDEADRESFRLFNEKVCGGKHSAFHFKVNALDGSTHYMESIAVPLHYGPGDEIVQLGITRDVTQERASNEERIRLEEQLRQAQKMESIGTLAGGIAHDFNNILSAIFGYTELAINEIDKPDRALKYLKEVVSGANRAKDLVTQILTFSRKTEQQLMPLRVELIVKEALKLLRSSIPTTIEIKMNIAQDCPTVMADPTHIHQIVMNLCTNAYHAMKDSGGELRVSLEPVVFDEYSTDSNLPLGLGSGSYIRLEVGDSGGGIPESVIRKIFEPYFTTKEKGEGTGLGLAVVHGIVTGLHGHISVESSAGRGTTFTVYLPTLNETEALPPEERTQVTPTGDEHILFVDDDETLVRMTTTLLERRGYKVTALTSSLEALHSFQETPDAFDLVITDMTMPKLTGIDLAKQMFALCPDLPIILCSGFSDLVNEEQARALGINEYIMKPVAQGDFLETVRKVLDASRRDQVLHP